MGTELRQREIDYFINSKNYKVFELHEIAALCARLLNSPLSLISIAGKEYYFHNKLDSGVEKEALKSFCHSLSIENPLVIVQDTLKDIDTIKNTYVHGRPYVRFFAAILLQTDDGHEAGCLSIADNKPKKLLERQIDILKILSAEIIRNIDFEFNINSLKQQFLQGQALAALELEAYRYKISSDLTNAKSLINTENHVMW